MSSPSDEVGFQALVPSFQTSLLRHLTTGMYLPDAFMDSANEQSIPTFFYDEADQALPLKIAWLQQQLDLSNDYLAALLRVHSERFYQWKAGQQPLNRSEIEFLVQFGMLMTHLLSFVNFRHELILRLLEFKTSDLPGTSLPFMPPWSGTSLKTFLQRNGLEGIQKVDAWVQGIRFSSST